MSTPTETPAAEPTPETGATPAPETPETPATETATVEDGDNLGDAGKKALSEERSARKAAEKELNETKTKLSELESEVSRLRRSNAANKGTDLEAIKGEVRSEMMEYIVRAEIKAAAAKSFRDPSDALLFVDVPSLVPASGEVDSETVTKAVSDVLSARPYLAAEQTPAWGPVAGESNDSKPEPKNAQERMARAYGSKN